MQVTQGLPCAELGQDGAMSAEGGGARTAVSAEGGAVRQEASAPLAALQWGPALPWGSVLSEHHGKVPASPAHPATWPQMRLLETRGTGSV